MGILNLTPDSFFDGGRHLQSDNIMETCNQMLVDGAHIIDIGGISTRPGAQEVSEQEELSRIQPVLKLLVAEFPTTWFSIDTYRSAVAEACIDEGARMINDISGGNMDNKMFKTIARLKVPYVIMHMVGTPQTMQQHPLDTTVVTEVATFFKNKIHELNELGISQIILDPGFGFGKTLEANFLLLKKLESLRVNNLPVLCGISRKSMINKVLGTKPAEALNGTSVLNTLALQNGANLLRVHDIKEAVQCIQLMDFYQSIHP